ncbi:MAG TPA: TonB family protein [Blastocatellia bacterium]|nr:TonB family protein [Blastocatellia bacterium]
MIAALNLACLLLTATANAPIPAMPSTAVVIFEDAELKEARQAYQAGDFQRAVTILKAYVEKKPKSFDGYFQLGLGHHALKQYPEAIAALEKAVQLKSNNALAQFELGQIYIDVKNYEGAIRQYRWLEKKDKRMSDEFRLYIPTEIARQHNLPPSLLDEFKADVEAAQPVVQMSPNLRPEITFKEKAKYTEEARNQGVQGIVVLNVIFSRQGKIIVSGVTRGLPLGLTEMAIEAARKIRFTPAIKDGQPVSVRGSLEFTFTLY